jgi:hypothetical protein
VKEQYSNNEYGQWIIKGEDPNCDFGGYHHNPILGYAEGKYGDVLEYAKTLKGWNTWGGGGYLERFITPKFKNIDSYFNTKRITLEKEKESLLKRIKEIDDEI